MGRWVDGSMGRGKGAPIAHLRFIRLLWQFCRAHRWVARRARNSAGQGRASRAPVVVCQPNYSELPAALGSPRLKSGRCPAGAKRRPPPSAAWAHFGVAWRAQFPESCQSAPIGYKSINARATRAAHVPRAITFGEGQLCAPGKPVASLAAALPSGDKVCAPSWRPAPRECR